MMRTRIDRFKVKREMEHQRIATLQDLAGKAGISQTTIYSAIDSYSWRGATLDAIASALGVNPVLLLTVDENAPEPMPEPRHLEAKTGAGKSERPKFQTWGKVPDASQIPADKAQAEVERRATLLAQAKGRQ